MISLYHRWWLNACLLMLMVTGVAQSQVTYTFAPGVGLKTLATTDPVKAAGIMSGVVSASSKWSAIISEPVTLKYTIDYDPSLPALGAAFDVYTPVPYLSIKPALISKATSAEDLLATSKLQAGPSLALWINGPPFPTFPQHLDADGSVNNSTIDISRTQLKGLGILPPDDGGPGADGTIKFGSAAFDFDPTDGITPGTYDFVGVAMHEMAHSMGFISGVDTLSTVLGSIPGPDATTMVTVLDMFRYSSDSFGVAPGAFIPDVSLPTPGFSSTRYFSIDGGVTPIELFSTGVGLAGDMKQAGHWKEDSTFGLMDPELAAGFTLTSTFEASLTGPTLPPDLIALDVIGWTIAPEPSTAGFALLLLLGFQRRRRPPR